MWHCCKWHDVADCEVPAHPISPPVLSQQRGSQAGKGKIRGRKGRVGMWSRLERVELSGRSTRWIISLNFQCTCAPWTFANKIVGVGRKKPRGKRQTCLPLTGCLIPTRSPWLAACSWQHGCVEMMMGERIRLLGISKSGGSEKVALHRT